MRHPVTEKYIKAIEYALKMFGEYTYYDKGPEEVMDVNIKPLLKLSQPDRIKVIKELMAYKHGPNLCSMGFGEFDGLSDADATALMAIVEKPTKAEKKAITVSVKKNSLSSALKGAKS